MFAIGAHGPQTYGDKPYLMHLDEVASVLVEELAGYMLPDELGSVAWLHDVLEDTHVGLDELEREFGRRVALAVFAVTGYGATREERWRSIYRNARMVFRDDYEAFMLAAKVKVADRIVNLTNSFKNRPDLYAAYVAGRADFDLTFARYVPTELKERLYAAYELGAQQEQAAQAA